MTFGQSKLATELVEADFDDDVESDSELVEKAKMGMRLDVQEAIRKFVGEQSAKGKAKLVKNLQVYHRQ